MAKNKLFQELNLNHTPKRNGYNLGKDVYFTAKAGELLPVWHKDVMFGDKFVIDLSHFTRTSEMTSSPMTKIREYFDFFFVPYRLLWKNSTAVHINNTRNPTTAETPYSNRPVGQKTPQFSFSKYYSVGASSKGYLEMLNERENGLGINRGILSMKLMNMLGYGYMTAAQYRGLYQEDTPNTSLYPFGIMAQDRVSLYPLLAYQKIYYDFFRNTQWEDNQPYNYNVDYLGSSGLFAVDTETNPNGYWDNPTVFDLRFANYPKDLFMGIIPDAQFGDTAVVEASSDSSVVVNNKSLVTSGSTNVVVGLDTLQGNSITSSDATRPLVPGDELEVQNNFNISFADVKANFNILELRKAQFTQKYKEIVGSGNSDYQSMVKKLFGVDIPDTLADHCIYLGGDSSSINISSETNSNLQNGDDRPYIRGNGTGVNKGGHIEFEAKEAGILMCIYHCQPVITYCLNAFHFDVTKTESDDFANPVFDQLGFQELPIHHLDISKSIFSALNPHLGYTTRYYDYKTDIDTVTGDFRETRKNWLAPLDMSYLINYVTESGNLDINFNFFKVDPAILDPIFYLKAKSFPFVDGDQFLVECSFGVNAVRPLDYFGVPY